MVRLFRIFIVVLLFTAICNSSFAQSMHEGQKAPEILLPNTKGDSVALSSSLKSNRYVLIDFWASWCGPCRRAMPGLKKLYSKYHAKGLEIYSISLDENANAWKRALFEDGTKWLHVIDQQGNTANNWGVSFIPNTYLLDGNQNIIAINAEPDELDKYLQGKLQ
ncbi:TlpA family protein disulfide reductase [Ilyomonas limi]|uniref:TlpA family protein disulfide reductase n=1 Tax=Ilyomonas limi TaxID=2575867 RepID=A0A4U3L3U2_9BACT|nr:TlpA disulfide reductase family protein [Ilyomonas limi]TKK68974.1 TlpA family protein disulfide reductase [Ilyomonas limi]